MAAGAAVAILAAYAGAVAAAFGLGILTWQLRQLTGKGGTA